MSTLSGRSLVTSAAALPALVAPVIAQPTDDNQNRIVELIERRNGLRRRRSEP